MEALTNATNFVILNFLELTFIISKTNEAPMKMYGALKSTNEAPTTLNCLRKHSIISGLSSHTLIEMI